MRKLFTVTLVLALSVTALGLSGCSLFSHATEDANGLINDANVNLKKYQASDDKVRQLAAQLNELGVSPADAAKALELTAQITAELKSQKTELATASDKIAKIKTLDVDDAFKKYADLEVEALAAQTAVVDEGLKIYAEMDKLYTGIRDGSADSKTTTQLSANISAIANNIGKLSESASKAIGAANTFFNGMALSK